MARLIVMYGQSLERRVECWEKEVCTHFKAFGVILGVVLPWVTSTKSLQNRRSRTALYKNKTHHPGPHMISIVRERTRDNPALTVQRNEGSIRPCLDRRSLSGVNY